MGNLGSMLCGHCNHLHRSSVLCDCEGARAERTKHLTDTLDAMKHRSDQNATLAFGQPIAPGGMPAVIVGLPDTVWLKLQSGETVDFDLRHGGIFANLVIIRGKDGADIAAILGQAQADLDTAPDVSVEKPTTQ